MLALTDSAIAVIRDLTARQEAPEGAGLRIAAGQATRQLMLRLEPRPHEGDQVLDASGVRVFLSSEAAGLLDDKDLDAAVDADGTVRFALTHRGT
jgi:Fe-S cluster assembly iron-binding protein IscA